MKLIIWVVALVLAVPTVGVSLILAIVATIYLNKQENVVAAHVLVTAASTMKNDILGRYDRLRAREGLSPTKESDSNIASTVLKFCGVIEASLEKSGRFHNDKDEVIQLAVRLTSYAEDLMPDDFAAEVQKNLAWIANDGVSATLQRPYRNEWNSLAWDDDNDVPF